jgi:hypothetical protein
LKKNCTATYHSGHIIRNDKPGPHSPGDTVGWEIARVSGGGGNHLDNARLISAAPELFEALKALIDCYGSGGTAEQFVRRIEEYGFVNDARKAIARAEESNVL